MSCSKWAYTPEMCDGDICVGDCDLCDKPKTMPEFEKCNSDGEKMVEKCDYIKRDAVSDYLESNNMPWRDWVKDIPSADVVEVVRCADCVYRPCEMMPHSYDFDYCSYGERADT